MIGANVRDLERLAGDFERAATLLERDVTAVRNALRRVPWDGAAADRFRSQWVNRDSRRIASLVQELRESARTLRANASDQERVSSGADARTRGARAAFIARLPKFGIRRFEDIWDRVVRGTSRVLDLGTMIEFRRVAQAVAAVVVGRAVHLMTGRYSKAFFAANGRIGGLMRGSAAGRRLARFGSAFGISEVAWHLHRGDQADAVKSGSRLAGARIASLTPAGPLGGLAFEAGWLIGEGADELVRRTTGESITSRWMGYAVGGDSDLPELRPGMSRDELQAHSEAAMSESRRASERVEELKNPLNILKRMVIGG